MRIRSIVSETAVFAAVCLVATVAFAGAKKYIGNSSVQRLGDVGVFTFHDDCAAAFKGGKWCTSEQIIVNGPGKNAPNPSTLGEWVSPRVVGGTTTNAIDYSLVEAPLADLNCDGWIDDDGGLFGLTFITRKLAATKKAGARVRFDLRSCGTERSAACCK